MLCDVIDGFAELRKREEREGAHTMVMRNREKCCLPK